MKHGTYALQPLDLWASHFLDHAHSALFLFIRVTERPDPQRLRMAVAATAGSVPEILCRLDRRRAVFADAGLTPDDAVADLATTDPVQKLPHINTDTGPMLRITVSPAAEGGYDLIIGISHILADVSGLKSYASMLLEAYNDPACRGPQYRNMRDMRELLSIPGRTDARRLPEVRKAARLAGKTPLPMTAAADGSYCRTNRTDIAPQQMEAIKRKGRDAGATLNDILLTALSCTLSRYGGQQTVVISCPADMRSFFTAEIGSRATVTNFSSFYISRAEIFPGATFDSVLDGISRSMLAQKRAFYCFGAVRSLYRLYRRVPLRLMNPGMRMSVKPARVMYSNIGLVDPAKIALQGNRVTDCFISASFTPAPRFRITISTFEGRCTLSSNTIGTGSDHAFVTEILEYMRSLITGWAGC